MPHQSQTGSSVSWKDAPTKSVNVDGTKFVYRQLGSDTGVPMIFLNHLAGTGGIPGSSTASQKNAV
jgi:hypothetical protein